MPPNRIGKKPLSPRPPAPDAVFGPVAVPGDVRDMPRPGGRAAMLAALRRRIARIERHGVGRGEAAPPLSVGVPALDAALPDGGLRRAALHEVLAAEADGAAAAFTALLAARRAAPGGGTVLWCTAQRALYGPGLAAFGLMPERLLLAWGRSDDERLWAMEEALRCPRLAAVVGEVRRLDLKQGRRLQLAAAASGVTALLLRPPGVDAAAGAGAARFRLTLLRARGGLPGDWCVQWDGQELTLVAGHEDDKGQGENEGRGSGAGASSAAGAVVALVADGAA